VYQVGKEKKDTRSTKYKDTFYWLWCKEHHLRFTSGTIFQNLSNKYKSGL